MPIQLRPRWFAAVVLCCASLGAWAAGAAVEDTPAAVQRAGVTLRGSLLEPADFDGRWVALIVAGSGPTDRNGNNPVVRGSVDNLRLLAEGLARAGIATLRYDKRGVAGSASAQVVEGELRFDDFAEDAVAWVDWLRRTGRFAHVAVIGHSEGATLGLLAAQRAPADAYVSVAGLSRDLLTLLDAQLQPRLAAAPALLAAHTRIIDALRHGATVPDVPAPLMSIYRPGVQPYLASAGKVDPSKEIAKLRIPVAIVAGENDVQVPAEDARQLSMARPGARLRVFGGMNHVMKTGAKGDLAAYTDPALGLTAGLVDFIADFVKGAAP
jgi:predicted alpha/beta hydrolase